MGGDWKDLYSEVRKRKMQALNKENVVKAVEKHGKILAFEGQYEKPETVLQHMYASEKQFIERGDIRRKIKKIEFGAYDIILIGCPGKKVPHKEFPRLKDYVLNGGWLITTDWAIESIIEPIFPGYIRWNRERTGDVVVPCQILQPDHPFLDGVQDEIRQSKWKSKDKDEQGFRWWLENRSYPIEILNSKDVHVLITSNAIKKKWGAGPVLVYFEFGKKGGRVIHLISHTHLQKGGKKGKFTSAMILTNILDEKVSERMGIQKGGGYQNQWQASPPQSDQVPLEEQWINPRPQQEDFVNPSNVSEQGNIGLSTTSQIIEVDPSNPAFDRTIKCTYCGYDFEDSTKKIYKCKECGALYHENCIEQQLNEGACKKCDRILLW